MRVTLHHAASPWRRALAAASATVAALAISTAGSGLASAEDAPQVPVVTAAGAEAVSDQYIVVMRPGANANANRIAAADDARRNGAKS